MSYTEMMRRMDAIEKRQKDLERLVKGLKEMKKVVAPKKVAKKKAGEATSSDTAKKRKE